MKRIKLFIVFSLILSLGVPLASADKASRSTVGNGGDFREIIFTNIGKAIVKIARDKKLLSDSDADYLEKIVKRYTPRITKKKKKATKYEFYFLKKDWKEHKNDPYVRILYVAKIYLDLASISDPSDKTAKKMAMWLVRINKDIQHLTNPTGGEVDGSVRIDDEGRRYCAPFPVTKNTVAVCETDYNRVGFSGKIIVKISQHPKSKKFWGYIYKRNSAYWTPECNIETVKKGFVLKSVEKKDGIVEMKTKKSNIVGFEIRIDLPKSKKTKKTTAGAGSNYTCDATGYDGCWHSMGLDCELVRPGRLR